MNKDLAREILNSIEAAGNTDTKINHIVDGNLTHILNLSSGAARIQTNVVNRFKLILSQPITLSFMNPFEIRCVLCKKVISYPCWYYSIKYAVNHFHYFVCFDTASPSKPSTRCYRRD